MIRFVLALISSCTIVMASDSSSGQVLVQFDLVQLPDWSETVTGEFKNKIAEYTTSFCRQNFTFCGFQSSKAFTSANVVIESGYPKGQDVNTLMLFRVSSSTGMEDDENTDVANTALAAIVKDNRKPLQEDLIKAAKEPYEASFRVSYIDNVLVLEMGDQTLNSIIIPIVCVLVLLFTALILGLEARKRWKMKSHIKKIEKKLKQDEPLLKS